MSYEKGITPIVRQLSNNVNLYTGREGTPTYIPHSIQPVAEITSLGKHVTISDTIVNISSTGVKAMWLVPPNEYWTLLSMTASVSSGTWTMSGFRYRLSVEDGYDTSSDDPEKWVPGQSQYVDLIYDATGGKTYLSFDSNYRVTRFPPGAKMHAVVDGYTSTGNLAWVAHIIREIY